MSERLVKIYKHLFYSRASELWVATIRC